jgi:uncharacterized surface protein with fasciclin (FAS1) repeats
MAAGKKNWKLGGETMKRAFGFAGMMLALSVVSIGSMGVGRAADEPKDIVDTAVAAGSFNTLAAALKAADLVGALKGPGPFTVFAPTDEAFAKLPQGTLDELLKPENEDKLKSILLYHVVAGKVMAKDVVGIKEAKTLNGASLSVSVDGGKVMVDNAHVTQTDILADNGVIHVIDAVVLPKK